MSNETTREAVRRIAAERPELNQTDIGRLIGVSRERVRQIVTDEGLGVGSGIRGVAPRAVRKPRRVPIPVARILTGGVPVRLNSSTTGSIAELLAAADLMARGFVVFYPFRRNASCDLVILTAEGQCERIEVRSGYRHSDGGVRWMRRDRSKSDRYAVVLTGEPIVYSPPFPGDAASRAAPPQEQR